ncbi:Tn3 family transposase [Streptomyces sp. NPDC003015]
MRSSGAGGPSTCWTSRSTPSSTRTIAEFTSVATREMLSKDVLRRRLLLVLFGLGTNMGIKRVAVTGKHGESEATLRRVRHLFVNRANMRSALRYRPAADQDDQWPNLGPVLSTKTIDWDLLFYSKDGDLAGADKESQEVSMLALHLHQSALVHVNTLLMQEVLADPKWADSSPTWTAGRCRRCSGPT